MENNTTPAPKKQLTPQQIKQLAVKNLFSNDDIKKRFDEMLGKRSASFITSVLQIVNSSDMLKDADPMTIYSAAATAASFDLPINPNLGFAYIIPYNVRQKDDSYRVEAQFQMGYKGYIQLAQRSGVFKTIAMTPVFEGQLIEENPLEGNVFDWTKRKSDKVIGYVGFFRLLNGFEKSLFMTTEEMTRHAKRYSQTFAKGFGRWKDDFDPMALKTVIKLLLSRFAPLSIEMQRAIEFDSAVIEDDVVKYVDNEKTAVNKELERFRLLAEKTTSSKELEELAGAVANSLEGASLTDEMNVIYNAQLSKLLDAEDNKKETKDKPKTEKK